MIQWNNVIPLVPSRPPNSINAESHVTLTTIPVAWQPIDPHHIHGVVLGYKVRYQAVAIGQEGVEDEPIREERVGPTTLSFVLKNLEIFTLYRVDVLAYTIVGDGPPVTDYAGLVIPFIYFNKILVHTSYLISVA